MAINLIDKMHEMYLGDRVTIDITKTLDIILQEQEKNLTDIEKQKLLNYATWFLENIEKDSETKAVDKEQGYFKRNKANM